MSRTIFEKWDTLEESSLPFTQWPNPARGGVRMKIKIDPRTKRINAVLNVSGESIVETGEELKPGDVVLAVSQASSKAVQFVMAHKITKVYSRGQYGKTGVKVSSVLVLKTPVAVLYDADHSLE